MYFKSDLKFNLFLSISIISLTNIIINSLSTDFLDIQKCKWYLVFTNFIITITSSSPHLCNLLPLISTLYTCNFESQDNSLCHGPRTNMMGIIIYASLVNLCGQKLQNCRSVQQSILSGFQTSSISEILFCKIENLILCYRIQVRVPIAN